MPQHMPEQNGGSTVKRSRVATAKSRPAAAGAKSSMARMLAVPASLMESEGPWPKGHELPVLLVVLLPPLA